MELLRQSLLFLHFVGLAALLGGFLAQWRVRSIQVSIVMLVGAGAQVLTGLLLFAVAELQDDPVDLPKNIVKLVVGIVVVLMAQLGRRRADAVGLFYTIGILTLINLGIAVFWH